MKEQVQIKYIHGDRRSPKESVVKRFNMRTISVIPGAYPYIEKIVHLKRQKWQLFLIWFGNAYVSIQVLLRTYLSLRSESMT